ncbi:Kunitz-type protease inhibitor 1 [Liparis tanakae]|uniref:Kunitz-type protease inhibitor 1 n=1 Tax=Liparis tanakae TaxID=230148 RepID=A0A4Z2ETZ6_9TELE|nr:Kunitz-type protease inhibitor 1 [Liparis tanakae]
MGRSSVLLWVLLGPALALALGCDWDPAVDPEQGLAVTNASIMMRLDTISEVPDPESCRTKCCTKPDCDLALVHFPADGPPQCLLVTCVVGDRDVCVLGPATRSRVYRRKGPRGAGSPPHEAGEKLHLAPLMGSWEPGTNETENQASAADFTGVIRGHQGSCSSSSRELSPSESDQDEREDVLMSDAMETFMNQMLSLSRELTVQSTKQSFISNIMFQRCGAEPQVGPCRAAFEHWFYNGKTGSCQSFIYGGCRGNQNNYVSKESCMATCTGEQHTCLHLYSDKEELLPDPDEQSSLESLAVPEA